MSIGTKISTSRSLKEHTSTILTKSKHSRLPVMCWWWGGRCPGRWQSAAGRGCWRPGLRSAGCLAACPPPLWWPYGCPCWEPSAARSSCHTLPCNSARRAQLQEGTWVGRKNPKLDPECHLKQVRLDWGTLMVDVGKKKGGGNRWNTWKLKTEFKSSRFLMR